MTGRRRTGHPVAQPGDGAKHAVTSGDSSYVDSPDHDTAADLLAPGEDTAQPTEHDRLESARDELATICGQINDGHRQLIELMRRVLADELWAGAGLKSPEHWLTAFAGLTWSSAHDVVRIARRADELPTMTTLLDDGRLTLGQAAVVAKYTPTAYDADVAEFASYATVTQLRRSLTRYEFNAETVAAPEADPAPAHVPADPADDVASQEAAIETALEAAERRAPDVSDPITAPAQLQMRYAAGRFKLTYDAPADLGALVEQALLEAKDSLFALRNAGHPNGPRTGAAAERSAPGSAAKATLGDAMSVLAQRSLDTAAPVGTSRASRYRVYLHLDTQGNAWLHKGTSIPPSLRDRLLCDGVCQPIWESEGRPVSVGRAQRIVPDRTRRLVEDRDRGCRFPGCLALHNLECHHLDHWIDGGPTDEDRLLMLCRFHHHEHHRGTFTMVGDPSRPDGVIFTERGGGPIGPRRRPPQLLHRSPPQVPQQSEAARPFEVPHASGAARPFEVPHASAATGISGDAQPKAQADDEPEAHQVGIGAGTNFSPYLGPSNDTLHLAWVRFDPRRRAHTGTTPTSDEDDPDSSAAG